ncbi:predicted protein [Uncinocarpus reesii 1704]|uniref:Uncharacterized protein n=1 Tax=Uncinocarpus reesii (strain UAMH 1704) TaxID=336963 RepID=C4JEA4_UNCRE|nr:uncharacterized protein UREG_00526 [Uncinocarpus reesii 1704]EEP75680.1 predicted protein [Uncinocarpus reesii 1704]
MAQAVFSDRPALRTGVDYRLYASKRSIRKVAAQEIYDLQDLRKVYTNPERNGEAVLRVFHVQNADWAARYLLRKFNIDNRDDLVGTDFGRYVRHRRPERRGGKPFLSGKTWKVQYDPWRGISKTSFSVDYLKQYNVPDPMNRCEDDGFKMMELNCFDEQDHPVHGFDVYVQRLSCYIQHKQTAAEPPPTDPDITNPYLPDAQIDGVYGKTPKEYIPRLNTLDNGNAILIFDNSHSGTLDHTLIPPRQTWEDRWRRLPFFLAFESRDLVATDDDLAYHCTRVIMEDIFKVLSGTWDTLLDLAYDHVSILEDKIYEQPADETRAPELWTNSNLWLKMEKLMFLHLDIIKELKTRLRDLTDDMERDDPWLEGAPGDFERLGNLITEDLIKPTKNLISLLYQSVSIRDSRQNIRLSVSSMNVDTFSGDPSIKWYFIASVPFMLGVMIVWYFWKHALTSQQNTPYRRGLYENFFNDLANANPSLWSQTGPRNYIIPQGRLAKIKWYLIKRWSAPEKTIRAGTASQEDDLGVMARLKRRLIWRWTSQIARAEGVDQASLRLESGEAALEDIASDTQSVVVDGLANATELLAIPAAPAVERVFEEDRKQLQVPAVEERPSDEHRRLGRLSFHSHSRGSSAGKNSGILVEEEDWQWLSQLGREGKEWALRSASSRERSAQRKAAKEDAERAKDSDTSATVSKDDKPLPENQTERPQSSSNMLGVPRVVQPPENDTQ